ncbi:hypothetical protein [Sphingobacterium hotanense]|uniref:hypothetical protein n=1 Tax=Sphingobacterium TaxID=28453 RepID=UPI0021A36EA5|nr:hypothetical protein [Sphingobacterium hotanense]MCT1525065.1 hypothetical protein [Sphingobacterium hotanense]
MDLRDFQNFSARIEELLWFPKVFSESGNGMVWDSIPARNYFSTAWMDFFSGLNDGTFERLVEDIINGADTPEKRNEIEERLSPFLGRLKSKDTERENKRIGVKVNTQNFERYEEMLKEMSAQKVIFDIIRDEEDIREVYFIDFSPSDTGAYLLRSLQRILDSTSNAENMRIKELEAKISEMERANIEISTLLSGSRAQNMELKQKIEEDRERIGSLFRENGDLKEEIKRFTDSENGEADGAVKNNKLRMYYLYKLGFLDDAIWNDKLGYEQRVRILCRILEGGAIKTDTALRYYKLFNATGSVELRTYEAENEKEVQEYFRKLCPRLDLKSGHFINALKKNSH